MTRIVIGYKTEQENNAYNHNRKSMQWVTDLQCCVRGSTYLQNGRLILSVIECGNKFHQWMAIKLCNKII